MAETQEAVDGLTAVARAFVDASRQWRGDPVVARRLKHVADDLDQLIQRLADLRFAIETLPGSSDAPDRQRALIVGVRSAVLAGMAFALEDLLAASRRMSLLAEFHSTGEVLDDGTLADLRLEDTLARYDVERPDEIAHFGGPEQTRVSVPERARPVRCSIVPVMFATDRRRVEDAPPTHVEYADGRGDGRLVYGVAEVSIPRGQRHRTGRVERPSLWKLQFRENPERHVVIVTCEETDAGVWASIAKDRIAETGAASALVFVHGFRVSFDEAIRRAAQIGYDLQFPGLMAAFSWCSEARAVSYATDVSNARLAAPHLLEFLRALRGQASVQTVHVIAHSMGNLVLLEALRRLPSSPGAASLDEVVLAAPDYDADEFRMALGDLTGKARRYTLYGSDRDLALVASRRLRDNYPRAGDGGDRLLVVEGVESIDASAVGDDLLGLGHAYFASERTLLSDLFYVIRESLPPDRRAGLEEGRRGDLKYWVFVP